MQWQRNQSTLYLSATLESKNEEDEKNKEKERGKKKDFLWVPHRKGCKYQKWGWDLVLINTNF